MIFFNCHNFAKLLLVFRILLAMLLRLRHAL